MEPYRCIKMVNEQGHSILLDCIWVNVRPANPQISLRIRLIWLKIWQAPSGCPRIQVLFMRNANPVSILYKSIAGRYRPVRVADGPITAHYRFIKNASSEILWSVFADVQVHLNFRRMHMQS